MIKEVVYTPGMQLRTSFNVKAEEKETEENLKKMRVKSLIGHDAPKYTMPG